MDPEQEIFTELLVKLREKFGTDMVHDGFLPPDGTPYPFIYLAESQLIDSANKSAVFGNVYQSIKVWHDDPHKRGSVSKILLEIKEICRSIEHTDNFAWDVRGIDQKITTDSTTKQPLLCGRIEAEFSFS